MPEMEEHKEMMEGMSDTQGPPTEDLSAGSFDEAMFNYDLDEMPDII